MNNSTEKTEQRVTSIHESRSDERFRLGRLASRIIVSRIERWARSHGLLERIEDADARSRFKRVNAGEYDVFHRPSVEGTPRRLIGTPRIDPITRTPDRQTEGEKSPRGRNLERADTRETQQRRDSNRSIRFLYGSSRRSGSSHLAGVACRNYGLPN